MNDFVTELNTGIVVERPGFTKLGSDKMSTVLAEIYAQKKPVVFVDSTKKFFSDENLFSALEGNTDGLDMILEKRGVVLTYSDSQIVSQFIAFKKNLRETICPAPVKPADYPFAKVPESFDVLTAFKVTTKNVRRAVQETAAYSTGYTIGLRTLENLWKTASARWAGTGTKTEMGVSADGYNRRASILETGIEIGCQRIRRYELEQFALAQGWEFPTPAGA